MVMVLPVVVLVRVLGAMVLVMMEVGVMTVMMGS